MYLKNTITLTVLSDGLLGHLDIGQILEECDTGSCVLGAVDIHHEAITRAEMDQELLAAGSDETFFGEEDS